MKSECELSLCQLVNPGRTFALTLVLRVVRLGSCDALDMAACVSIRRLSLASCDFATAAPSCYCAVEYKVVVEEVTQLWNEKQRATTLNLSVQLHCRRVSMFVINLDR
jgi:hypothetical protein